MTASMVESRSESRGANKAPLAGQRRRGVFAFAIHLYHRDPTFRGFFDFAVIGAIVFLILNPPILPDLSTLWGPLTTSTGQTPTPQSSLGGLLEKDRPRLPKAPLPIDVELDTQPFDRSAPAVREQLFAATQAYRSAQAARALDILNRSDLADPNVIMLRGLAMLALPGHENLPSGLAALQRAADAGQRQAQTYLALLYISGSIGIERDQKRGGELLREAAENGDIEAARLLGKAYASGWVGSVDSGLAVKYLQMAVAGGNPQAAVDLAYFAYKGIGMAKDSTEAVRLLEVAAKSGYVPAQSLLGAYYLTEYAAGWMPDPKASVDLLTRAAAAGDAAAMFYLATLHGTVAKGPPWRDPEKAAALFKACAEKHYLECIVGYADSLRQGTGVDRDLVGAYAYYGLARTGGSLKAKNELAQLERLMTGEELKQARAREKQLARRASHRPLKPDAILPAFGGLQQELASRAKNAPPRDSLEKVLNRTEIGEFRRLPAILADEARAGKVDRAWIGDPSPHDVALYDQAADLIEQGRRSTAIKMLGFQAKAEDPNALYLYALAHINDRLSTRITVRVRKPMRRAAELGHADAAMQLGHYARDGEGVDKGPQAALDWYETALARGSERAATALGDLYLAGDGVARDPAKAMAYYEQGAERGDVAAWTKLGLHYLQGTTGPPDPLKARSWMERAARAGDRQAQWHLAMMLARGDGGAFDRERALEWTRKAANQGQPEAMHFLGQHYLTGNDGERDDEAEQALNWLRGAALRGHAEAQFAYADMHARGIGIAPDPMKALLFYLLSVRSGHHPAKDAIDALLPQLNCDQFVTVTNAYKAFQLFSGGTPELKVAAVGRRAEAAEFVLGSLAECEVPTAQN